MIIPYGTDAPIYHLPIITVAMILACVGMFVGEQCLAKQVYEELTLVYGHGLRPWQWVTSNFMHADVMHLLGNMFSLWAFGLVVEGKTGWWRFLLIFLGIGVAQCAVEQTMMLGAEEGGSLGASAIIYGLMAMAMVWAPENELQCAVLFFRFQLMEIGISVFVGLCLFLQVAIGVLAGLQMSSQILHLLGASAGFGVAVVMLKRKWVDCEGWDLFSVWAGKQGRSDEKEADDHAAADLVQRATKARLEATIVPPATATVPDPLAHAPLMTLNSPDDLFFSGDLTAVDPSEEIRQLIRDGKGGRAYAKHRQLQKDDPLWSLPEEDLLRIIGLMHEQKQWSASVPPMVEYLKKFKQRATQVRLKLAHILLEVDKSPAKALQVLKPLNVSALNEKEAQLYRKLMAHASPATDETRTKHG